LPRELSATAAPAICGPFSASVNDQNCPSARQFVFILLMYHSRQTDFTLSAADDLMDFLAGGVLTKLLDLPGDAGAAGE